jgi:hypothetical protein
VVEEVLLLGEMVEVMAERLIEGMTTTRTYSVCVFVFGAQKVKTNSWGLSVRETFLSQESSSLSRF